MSLFAVLAVMADLYLPFMIVLVGYTIFKTVKYNAKEQGVKQGLFFILLLMLVYIVQFIDHNFSIWAIWSLDYSTHTSFSLAIMVFFIFAKIKTKMLVMFSFAAYLILMIYQKYHTVSDILTTIALLLPLMGFIAYLMKKSGLKKIK